MTWVLVKDDIITNIIIYQEGSDYTPPEGYSLYYTDQWCDIGWVWNNGNPFDPNPPPPDPPL